MRIGEYVEDQYAFWPQGPVQRVEKAAPFVWRQRAVIAIRHEGHVVGASKLRVEIVAFDVFDIQALGLRTRFRIRQRCRGDVYARNGIAASREASGIETRSAPQVENTGVRDLRCTALDPCHRLLDELGASTGQGVALVKVRFQELSRDVGIAPE